MATSDDQRRSVTESSDELLDILCGPCEKDGKRVEAEGFCVDCSESLCRQCYEYHCRFKIFQNHVLQRKYETLDKSDTATTVHDTCETKCTFHPDKTIEYFCEQCDKVGCMVCITLSHRQCRNVRHIPDVVQVYNTDIKLKQIKKDLATVALELEHCKNKIDSNRSVAEKLRDTALVRHKTHENILRKTFETIGKQSENLIDDLGKKNTTSLLTAATRYVGLCDSISRMKSEFAAKEKNQQMCELFIEIKRSKTEIQEIKLHLQQLKMESRLEKIEFIPSQEVLGVLKNLQFGTIRKKNSAKEKAFVFCSSLLAFKGKDNTKNCISALTMVSDTFLVATDIGRSSIIVVDRSKSKIVSQLQGFVAGDVTTINESMVAASLPSECKIQFISLTASGSLKKDRQIAVKDCFSTWGIEYSSDMLFVACVNEVRKVDMEGNNIQTITYNSLGEEIFSGAYRLAVSAENDAVYVLDSYQGSIISMTLEGKVKDKYTNERLKKILSGISVDRDGSVYVHGEGVSNNMILSEDLEEIRSFNFPSTCSAFYMKSNTVYVGSSNGIDKYITN